MRTQEVKRGVVDPCSGSPPPWCCRLCHQGFRHQLLDTSLALPPPTKSWPSPLLPLPPIPCLSVMEAVLPRAWPPPARPSQRPCRPRRTTSVNKILRPAQNTVWGSGNKVLRGTTDSNNIEDKLKWLLGLKGTGPNKTRQTRKKKKKKDKL